MYTAKREARLLLISSCNGSKSYVILVFRGPYRVEYVTLGTWETIEELRQSSMFEEIRYGWPEAFARKIGIKPVPDLGKYFGSCLGCIKNFIKSLCNTSDSLIVYSTSLHFRSFGENNKRSQYLGKRATG